MVMIIIFGGKMAIFLKIKVMIFFRLNYLAVLEPKHCFKRLTNRVAIPNPLNQSCGQ
jgi:hypothetical protein